MNNALNQLHADYLREFFRHLRAARADYLTLVRSQRVPNVPLARQHQNVRVWALEAKRAETLLDTIAEILNDREAKAGICRFCGCDEMHACAVDETQACYWIDQEQTCCSASECAKAYFGYPRFRGNRSRARRTA